MAVVTFSKAVSFPIAPMRKLLSQHLPLYRWQCGEDDRGSEQDMGTFDNDPLIVGRSPETAIFIELKARTDVIDTPAPPHPWRLLVGTPTTELQPIADRATLIVSMTAMILDEDAALCQLVPGGNWLSAAELLRVFNAVLGGEGLGIAAGLGIPAAHFADASPNAIAHEQSTGALPYPASAPARPVVPPGSPPLVRRVGGFGRKGL